MEKELTDTEMLEKLMEGFFRDGQYLFWSYNEGCSVGEVLSPALEESLKKRFNL